MFLIVSLLRTGFGIIRGSQPRTARVNSPNWGFPGMQAKPVVAVR